MGEESIKHGSAATFVVGISDVDFQHTVVPVDFQVLADCLEEDGYARWDSYCDLLDMHAVASFRGNLFDEVR